MKHQYIPTSTHKNPLPPPTTHSVQAPSQTDPNPKLTPTCFQYVNPKLLLEWQGECRVPRQISGVGVFRAYERSKDGYHRAQLVMSLEAECWRNGKPSGLVKMFENIFYEVNRVDSVVKEIRKFTGEMHKMMKQGYGEYVFQYFYSNQTKKIIEIKGNWVDDFLVEGQVFQNGAFKEKVEFSNNIHKKPGQDINVNNIQLKVNDRRNFMLKLQAIPSNKCVVDQIDQSNCNTEKPETKTQEQPKITNLLAPPAPPKGKMNQKNAR